MKLDQRIRARKINYLLSGEARPAFEVALYYFIMAKNKKSDPKVQDACNKAVYWLKKARVEVGPGNIGVDELERLLVENKNILRKQDVGAR